VNLPTTALRIVHTAGMVFVNPLEVKTFLLVKLTAVPVVTIFVNINSKIQLLAQKIVELVPTAFVMLIMVKIPKPALMIVVFQFVVMEDVQAKKQLMIVLLTALL